MVRRSPFFVRRSHLARWLIGGVFVAGVCCARPARAAQCPVQLTGLESQEWQRAARSASELGWRDDDCAAIRLEIGHDEALLTFNTRDGRVAERRLSAPEELVPTVEALLVTGRDAALPAGTRAAAAFPPSGKELPAPKPPSTSRAVPEDSSPQSHPNLETAAPHRSGMAFALQTGARGGASLGSARGDADNLLVSPVLLATGSLTRGPLELAILGGFEFQYFDLEDHSKADRKSSAVVVGASLARHMPVRSISLLTGARVIVAELEHETEKGAAEGRAGIFGCVIYPRRAEYRLRSDVGVDIVAGRNRGQPITPGWAITGLLGMEIGGT